MKIRKIKKKNMRNIKNSRDGVFLGDIVKVGGKKYTIEAIDLNKDLSIVFMINAALSQSLSETVEEEDWTGICDIIYRKGAKKYGRWIKLEDIEKSEEILDKESPKKITITIVKEETVEKELTKKEAEAVRKYARQNNCTLMNAFRELAFDVGDIDLDKNSAMVNESIREIELEERD